MSTTILLIEDNEQNRRLATFLLEQRGHQAVSAPDGPRGVELAQTILPDIILLDNQLPSMDGYAVARALRSIESLRNAPIVALTSYAMVDDRKKSPSAGCTHYIGKPINPNTFVAEITCFEPPAQPKASHDTCTDRR